MGHFVRVKSLCCPCYHTVDAILQRRHQRRRVRGSAGVNESHTTEMPMFKAEFKSKSTVRLSQRLPSSLKAPMQLSCTKAVEEGVVEVLGARSLAGVCR